MSLPENTVVHVIKRGARGLPIVKDREDKYRVLKLLYFLNDSNHPTKWERDVNQISSGLHFQRPKQWVGKREPYVDIFSYCLMDNHIHLLLRSRQEGGISSFIGAFSSSMSQFFNKKYETKGGSIFSRPTKRKIVEDDTYLDHINLYINVKNTFELYPGGLEKAIPEFDMAFKHALDYPFSSLPDMIGKRNSPIITQNSLSRVSNASPKEYRILAKDFLQKRIPEIHTGESSLFLE